MSSGLLLSNTSIKATVIIAPRLSNPVDFVMRYPFWTIILVQNVPNYIGITYMCHHDIITLQFNSGTNKFLFFTHDTWQFSS